MASNILAALLEGEIDNTPEVTEEEVNDIEISDDVTKEIEESTMPFDMLIESVMTDVAIDINKTTEVFEMACIIGGAQVVVEGTGAEGAQAVLENAVTDFFGRIIARLKKIWEWFVGIIKRIKDKFKKNNDEAKKMADANIGDALKDIQEVEQAAKSGGPTSSKDYHASTRADRLNDSKDKYVYFHGKLIKYKEGNAYVDGISKKINSSLSNLDSMVKEIRPLAMGVTATQKTNNIRTYNTLAGDKPFENIAKDVGLGDKCTNTGQVRVRVRNMYGVNQSSADANKGKEPEPIKVTDAILKEMKAVVDDSSKAANKSANEGIKAVSDRCKTLIGKFEQAMNSVKGNHSEYSALGKATQEACTHVTAMVNMYSNIYAALINSKMEVLNNASGAYARFIKARADRYKHQRISAKKSVQDGLDYGLDYSVYFERDEMVDIEDEEDVEESYGDFGGNDGGSDYSEMSSSSMLEAALNLFT